MGGAGESSFWRARVTRMGSHLRSLAGCRSEPWGGQAWCRWWPPSRLMSSGLFSCSPLFSFSPFFFFFKHIFILNTFPICLMCFVKLGWALGESTHSNVCNKNGGGGSGSFDEGCGGKVDIGTRLCSQKPVFPTVGQPQDAGHRESLPVNPPHFVLVCVKGALISCSGQIWREGCWVLFSLRRVSRWTKN